MDVRIDYSTDGGATWKGVTPSVDVSSPNWLNFPWTVPDEPSTQCQITISGYIGGSIGNVYSGTFTIQ